MNTLLCAEYLDRSEVLELSVGVRDGLSQVKGQTTVHAYLRVLIRRQNTRPRRQTKVRCEGRRETQGQAEVPRVRRKQRPYIRETMHSALNL